MIAAYWWLLNLIFAVFSNALSIYFLVTIEKHYKESGTTHANTLVANRFRQNRTFAQN